MLRIDVLPKSSAGPWAVKALLRRIDSSYCASASQILPPKKNADPPPVDRIASLDAQRLGGGGGAIQGFVAVYYRAGVILTAIAWVGAQSQQPLFVTAHEALQHLSAFMSLTLC